MQILFVCPLIEKPTGSRMWEPKILSLISLPPAPCKWSTTSALAAFKFAVGRADITPAQQAAIDLDSTIVTVQELDFVRPFSALTVAAQSRISNFLTSSGLPTPTIGETSKDVLSRLSQRADNKTIDTILATRTRA